MTLRYSITQGLKLLAILSVSLAGCENTGEQTYVSAAAPVSEPLKPRKELRVREQARLKQLQDTVYTPPHIDQKASLELIRIAVLLPLSSSNEGVRREARGLLAAAQLALFTLGTENIVLLPKDTGGNPKTALAAAHAALQEGAAVIIGPLFSANARAIAGPARKAGVPILSFSTDARIGGEGVYLLSLSPDEEVRSIIDWAMQEDINRLVMFGPRTPYGKRMEALLRERAAFHKVPVVEVQFYERSNSSPMKEAEALARIVNDIVGSAAERTNLEIENAVSDPNLLLYDEAENGNLLPSLPENKANKRSELDVLFEEELLPRTLPDTFEESLPLDPGLSGPVEPETTDLAEANGSAGTTGTQLDNPSRLFANADEALFVGDTLQDQPRQETQKVAILIPEGGLRLRAVAPLLPYHDVDLSRIQLLGTGLWNDAEVWREPTLIGGVFAAPDPKSIARFRRRYLEAEGSPPGRLSSLGYDAALLAIQLGAQHRLDKAALEHPDGFVGANGAFRLTEDGSTRHALAVLRVTQRGRVAVIQTAEKSFSGLQDPAPYKNTATSPIPN